MYRIRQFNTLLLLFARNPNSGLLLILLCLSVYLSTGCTPLRHDFETPSVGITSFKPLISQGFAPRFEITMRVVNPNAAKLSLRGMSYKLFINDYEVVEGAANDLPDVPGYGEAEFKVVTAIGLVEGIQFVNQLLQNKTGQFTYRFKTKLDIGAMAPAIRTEKTGSFSPEASSPD